MKDEAGRMKAEKKEEREDVYPQMTSRVRAGYADKEILPSYFRLHTLLRVLVVDSSALKVKAPPHQVGRTDRILSTIGNRAFIFRMGAPDHTCRPALVASDTMMPGSGIPCAFPPIPFSAMIRHSMPRLPCATGTAPCIRAVRR
jgi:hypothetical protein